MGPQSILDRVRAVIASMAFSVFLWGIRMTADEYFMEIARQEANYGESELMYEEES